MDPDPEGVKRAKMKEKTKPKHKENFVTVIPGSRFAFILELGPDLDPDPHLPKKLVTDPHEVNADPKHCYKQCCGSGSGNLFSQILHKRGAKINLPLSCRTRS
jgi:hypothetical protein